MAKKRKKSRRKQNKQRSATQPTESTTVDAEARAEDDVVPIDLDAEVDSDLEDASVEELLKQAAGMSSEDDEELGVVFVEEPTGDLDVTFVEEAGDDLNVVFVDDPEDDIEVISLDDPDEEVTTISLDDDVEEDADSLIAQALAAAGEEEEGTSVPAAAHSEPTDDGAVAVPTPADPTPVMTPDALEALQELRTEGVGASPEVVLDLGEGGTPEDRDRLLRAALAHVEMQEAVYRVPTETSTRRRRSAGVTAAVLVVALWVAVAPPAILVPPSAPGVDTADRIEGVQTALWLQVQQIEAFRVENGRLPDELSELRYPLAGMTYVRSSSRLYQVVARAPDGSPISYDSASPDPVFVEISGRLYGSPEEVGS